MTAFSKEWQARMAHSVMADKRRQVNKECGVPDEVPDNVKPIFDVDRLVAAGREPDNLEFVDITGMGVSRIPAPQSRGVESAKRKPAKPDPSPADRSATAAPSERHVLAAVIRALALHPKVAWAHRMNVGAFKDGDRFVRFGFRGCSDIMGQMKDGRFLAVECKRPGGKLTEYQLGFLVRVQNNGGVAFVARSVDDVMKGLA